jgi:hypothetical protein
MVFCITCRYVSPSGSIFCSHCGRTFGARLCPSRHRNPIDAQHCVQCGKPKLTDPTRYLAFGWFSAVIAWTVIALVIKVIICNIKQIGNWLEAIGGWAIVHLFGVSPCWVVMLLDRLMFWYLLLMGLSFLLPIPTGPRLRANLLTVAWKAIRVATNLAKVVLLWLFKLLIGLLKRD